MALYVGRNMNRVKCKIPDNQWCSGIFWEGWVSWGGGQKSECYYRHNNSLVPLANHYMYSTRNVVKRDVCERADNGVEMENTTTTVTPTQHPTRSEGCGTPPKMSLLTSPQTPISLSEKDKVMPAINLWEECRLCEEEIKETFGINIYDDADYSSTEDEDEYFDSYCAARKKKAVMTRLPCGDIHICGAGYECPYKIISEDNISVCKYSGIEFGPEPVDDFFDLNGGTHKRSGDPDQTCGEQLYSKFQYRPDAIAASKAAYQAASSISDTDVSMYVPLKATDDTKQRPSKRGALCVGEVVEFHKHKVGRVSKKEVDDKNICTNLHAEAERVLEKLVNYDRSSSFNNKQTGIRMQRNRLPTDPRMRDANFVFNVSVKKYVRMCLSDGVSPTIDAINNLAMMAQTISKKTREDTATKSRKALQTAKFRSTCCAFIVALWCAVCKTPYMQNAKRGTDAYRPFICGVIYSMKRGVTLRDGTILVPRCPQLAAALPVLRGTGGNMLAKTLQSSSHRGRCALSRCIASVPDSKQRVVFAHVIQIAHAFTCSNFTAHDI